MAGWLGERDRYSELENAAAVPAVPDAPLKSTWHETAFRRAVAWAAENGFDRVAWTPGEMQAERYDLSKQVDYLLYRKNDDGTYSVSAVLPTGQGQWLGDAQIHRN